MTFSIHEFKWVFGYCHVGRHVGLSSDLHPKKNAFVVIGKNETKKFVLSSQMDEKFYYRDEKQWDNYMIIIDVIS